jgi:hypothetical protein
MPGKKSTSRQISCLAFHPDRSLCWPKQSYPMSVWSIKPRKQQTGNIHSILNTMTRSQGDNVNSLEDSSHRTTNDNRQIINIRISWKDRRCWSYRGPPASSEQAFQCLSLTHSLDHLTEFLINWLRRPLSHLLSDRDTGEFQTAYQSKEKIIHLSRAEPSQVARLQNHADALCLISHE